ncbi:hypothetical protein JW948_18055 [bacterium]|nr:hypothetical protein [bacterium]
MKRIWRLACACCVVLLLCSCAAHHSLHPEGKGNWSGNMSVGGPVIEVFGTRIPVPYLTMGATYGWKDRINLTGDLHLFPLAYQIAGLDAGAAWFLCEQDGCKPVLGLQGRIMMLASLKKDVPERVKLFPIFTPTTAWQVKRGMLYTGLDTAIPLSSPDYDKEAPAVLLSPFFGYRWTMKPDLLLYTELKWQCANLPSDKLAVNYLPVAGHGAMSVLVSVERGF